MRDHAAIPTLYPSPRFVLEPGEKFWSRPQSGLLIKANLERVLQRLKRVLDEMEHYADLSSDGDDELLEHLAERHSKEIMSATVELAGYILATGQAGEDSEDSSAKAIVEEFGDQYQELAAEWQAVISGLPVPEDAEGPKPDQEIGEKP